jgi:hypothetical protein
MTTITRIGYCAKCYKANKPEKGQPFLLFGSSSNDYKMGIVHKDYPERGLTPHLFTLIRVSADCKSVYYKEVCCMAGCGTIYSEDYDGISLIIDRAEESGVKQMPIRRWHALVMYKDETLKL